MEVTWVGMMRLGGVVVGGLIEMVDLGGVGLTERDGTWPDETCIACSEEMMLILCCRFGSW